MGDRRQDHYARRAKQEGRPARSVYKLQEIDLKVRLFLPGQRVLDLGASPGSWSQYAAEKVGRTGEVMAYDLKPLEVSLPEQVIFGSIASPSVRFSELELMSLSVYNRILQPIDRIMSRRFFEHGERTRKYFQEPA